MRRSIVSLMLLSLVLILSSMSVLAQEDNAQRNKQIYLNVVSEYNAGNREAFYSMVTDPFMMNQGDATLYETSSDEVKGYDGALAAAMPDMQMNADVVIAQGDWVAAFVRYTGTFTEPFSFTPFGPDSFPANNEAITWTELNFLRFDTEGLVDTVWLAGDPTVLFGQMGIFPMMGGGGDASETVLEQPVGYQLLSADDLAATYTTGMEERNTGLWQDCLNTILGESNCNTNPFISWRNGVPLSADPTDPGIFGVVAVGLPDTTVTATVTVAEGDWVASLVTFSGTFTEDIDMFGMSLPASNETITWQVGVINHFNDDGLIDEELAETDISPLLIGLGMMPPMGE